MPIVITLAADGVLRGFVNVCRHRGAILATGAARRGTVQCPYHAWTYDLDGRLRAAPRSAEDPAFAACDLGLVPVSVGTWGPFVFANPDPAAEPLADALGDLPAVVAEHGLDVDALRFNRRVRYEIRANWKIALENYLECYHCPVNHPGLVEVIDERRLELVAHGRRTSQFAPVHPHTLEGRGPIDVSDAVGAAQNHLWFPDAEVQRAARPPQPVAGAAVADRPRDVRGIPGLLVRRERERGLDRGAVRAGQPDRRRGHGAGGGRPARAADRG